MDHELCFLCGDRTGMEGMKEDSIYHDGRGPFCPSCFDKLHGMDRKPMNKVYHVEGRDGNTEEGIVVASDMESAVILMGYGKKWNLTVIGTAREDQPEDVLSRADTKDCRAIPHNAVCFYKDGDQWCCVFGDFINLQESPAGFGSTFDASLESLKQSAKVESIPDIRVEQSGIARVV